jgi:hypothetical protein
MCLIHNNNNNNNNNKKKMNIERFIAQFFSLVYANPYAHNTVAMKC